MGRTRLDKKFTIRDDTIRETSPSSISSGQARSVIVYNSSLNFYS